MCLCVCVSVYVGVCISPRMYVCTDMCVCMCVYMCVCVYLQAFEVRMLMMNVISRLVGHHELVLLNFYDFLRKYMQAHQENVTKILSYAIQVRIYNSWENSSFYEVGVSGGSCVC